jgi:hypothetical protein
MISLKKKRQLRRLRAEQDDRRFMMNLFRWLEAARRFDQSHEPPTEPDDPALKLDSVEHT